MLIAYANYSIHHGAITAYLKDCHGNIPAVALGCCTQSVCHDTCHRVNDVRLRGWGGDEIKFSFAGHDRSLTTFVPTAEPIGLN